MSSKCEICADFPDSVQITSCCLKAVCSRHGSDLCQLCSQKSSRLPYVISICQRCQLSALNLFCETCNVYLCTACNDLIHSKGKYSKHKIKNYSAGVQLVCASHALPLTFYCSLCSLCCINCACPHNKQDLKETEKLSRALQEQYLSEITKKIKYLKTTQKTLAQSSQQKIEKFQKSIEFVKSEFRATQQILKEKEEAILKAFSSQLSVYCQATSFVMSQISEDIKTSSYLFNLLSLPTHSYLLAIEACLSRIPELSEYKLPDVELGLNFSLSRVNQSILLLNSSNEEVYESPKVTTPRSMSKEASHKRLDSQELPPRPSRASMIPKQTSGKSLTRPEDQVTRDSLGKRTFITSLQTDSAIKLSWTHPSLVSDQLEYVLECSLDGQDFRVVYKGKPKTCIITELISDKEYFFLVYPVIGETKGEPSDVLKLSTFPSQFIDGKLCSFAVVDKDWVEFKGNGTVFSQFPYLFGKHYWEVTVCPSAALSGFVKIGVSTTEKKSVIGRSILYSKNETVVRVMLDIENSMLLFFDSSLKEEDALKVPQDVALFAAVQHKSGKNSQVNLKIQIVFHNEYS